ncbi:hypothetical protein LR48_Vigan10g276800 [Vigna angularis]|uniref:Uncharacterized protein n=1 Tax=Phaseolus angularis TaxID=3914 RepID=A0A0L9VP83_PHAAN|nr:hypothetical protein LR48_Vigan10g276800 [Vigna angularis]
MKIRRLEEEVFNEMSSFNDCMEGPSTNDKIKDLAIVNFVDTGMEGPSTHDNIDFASVYTTCTPALYNDGDICLCPLWVMTIGGTIVLIVNQGNCSFWILLVIRGGLDMLLTRLWYDCGLLVMKYMELWDNQPKFDGGKMPDYSTVGIV